MLFLENQRRLGRRVKHGCVVAGPCFALYSDEAAWGRWGGLVRICSASAMGALGPQHLGGVFLVENFVAVAAFKCLLDHGGLLFRRGMRFGRAAVRASCPLHGKVRLLFLENEKGLVGEALEVWWTWSWRFGGHGVGGLVDMELGMRLAAWRAWRRRAACGLVGDVGNAWCSKCWLCWRGLAVEMLRAWVRGNIARAACDLVRGSALVAVWRVK